jgi:hypothetical protein
VLTPDLTIVEASEEYLSATLTWREEVRGCGLFDVFPDNPHNPSADGVKNLADSLAEVRRSRAPHCMSVQRYDVRDQVASDGAWIEKHWLPVNSAAFGSGSQEITHLIHQVEDVTQTELLRRWINEQFQVLAEQSSALDRIQQEFAKSQRESSAARTSLAALLRARATGTERLVEIQRRIGAPESRRYLTPGQRAPVSGIYNVYHIRACEWVPRRVFMRAGRLLRPCRHCGEGTLYRLMLPLSS